MLMNHVNSCHGNNVFFIVQLSISCTTKILCVSGVPMNNLALMKKISPQVILICNKLERFIYINNTYMNCFKSSICSVPYTSVWLRVVITWIDNIAYYI